MRLELRYNLDLNDLIAPLGPLVTHLLSGYKDRECIVLSFLMSTYECMSIERQLTQ